MTLADLLRAEAAAGDTSSARAIINVHLDGGPPQMDKIDPNRRPQHLPGQGRPIRELV